MKLTINPNAADPKVVQENFKELNNALQNEPLLKTDFKFFEIVVPKATADQKYRHGLKFRPKDVLVTSSLGPGELVFHYDRFDETNIMFSTTDACTIRCFVGAYR